MKKVYLILCLLAVVISSNAEVTHQYGFKGRINENYVSGLPIKFDANYSMSQQIFTPQEVGVYGQITGINFWGYKMAGTFQYEDRRDIEVYVGTTIKYCFFSTNDWIPVTQMTKVYSGKVEDFYGIEHITFSSPFTYNGTSNLVIYIRDYTNSSLSKNYNFASSSAYDRQYDGYGNALKMAIFDYSSTVISAGYPSSSCKLSADRNWIEFRGTDELIGINVGGVQITNDNKSHFTNGLTSGYMIYYNDTLELNNVVTDKYLNCRNHVPNNWGNRELTIVANGYNNFKSGGLGCVYNGTTTITGDGTLDVSEIYVSGPEAEVIFRNADARINLEENNQNGLYGESETEKLKIYNSNVKVYGSKSAISGFKSNDFEDSYVAIPENIASFQLDGVDVADTITIYRGYGILLGGVPLGRNDVYEYPDDIIYLKDITMGLTSGYITFNPNLSSLTLNNVQMDQDLDCRYLRTNSFLSVVVVGKNNFKSGKFIASKTAKTSISQNVTDKTKGDDVLDVAEIVMGDTVLRINNVSVKVNLEEGNDYALKGTGKSVLSILGDTLKAYGKVATFDGIDSIDIDKNLIITQPVGAIIEDGTIKLNGKTVADTVVIEPIKEYGISIGGVKMTSVKVIFDAADSITGTITYDPVEQTLTLDNIDLPDKDISCFDHKGNLKIILIGNNNMKKSSLLVSDYGNTTITGDGVLNIAKIVFPFDNPYNRETFIENTTVLVNIENGNNYGISGVGKTSNINNLTIDNSYVKVFGAKCAIGDFQYLTIRNAKITCPVGAVIDHGSIVLNGEVVVDTVIIEPIGTGIEKVQTKSFQIYPNPAIDEVTLHLEPYIGIAQMQIYSADGKLVTAVNLPAIDTDYKMNVETLPAGMYFVNVMANSIRQEAAFMKK